MDGGLRSLFHKNLPDAHWQSIETWGIAAGVPDAEYCFPGGLQGWVEFKVTGTDRVIIRPAQIAWAERRSRMGGRVFLAVRKKCLPGLRRSPLDALFLYRGRDMRGVLENGLSVPPIGTWDGGPASWDWERIRGMLTERNIINAA